MRITLDFEHSHELIDLLKSLGSSLKKDEPCIELQETYPREFEDSFSPLNTFGYMDDLT